MLLEIEKEKTPLPDKTSCLKLQLEHHQTNICDNVQYVCNIRKQNSQTNNEIFV